MSAARGWGLVVACGFLLATGVWWLRAEGPLLAGAARRDITPREPVPLWGYGSRHDELSTGVRDPLFADAVVIAAGGRRLAIVALDLGRSPAEASLQRIRARLRQAGIEHALLAASHTHHGPVLELTNEPGKGRGRFDAALRYYRRLEDAIVEAVLEANQNLRPARLAAGAVTTEGRNRNRHSRIEPKPVDRQLAVLQFVDEAGQAIATLVNFAAHPTMLPAAELRFSADYVGALKREVTRRTGAPALFLQGAAGDLSVQDSGTPGPDAFGAALGKLASGAITLRPADKPARGSLEIAERRFRFASRIDFSNPLILAAYRFAFFPELIPNYADEYADGIRPRLTVALLHPDIAFVCVSGEFFSSHALRLRERARVRHLFFVGYCNGYHQYFPTIEALAEGGYGADSRVSPAAAGAGEQIMDTALLLILERKKAIPPGTPWAVPASPERNGNPTPVTR